MARRALSATRRSRPWRSGGAARRRRAGHPRPLRALRGRARLADRPPRGALLDGAAGLRVGARSDPRPSTRLRRVFDGSLDPADRAATRPRRRSGAGAAAPQLGARRGRRARAPAGAPGRARRGERRRGCRRARCSCLGRQRRRAALADDFATSTPPSSSSCATGCWRACRSRRRRAGARARAAARPRRAARRPRRRSARAHGPAATRPPRAPPRRQGRGGSCCCSTCRDRWSCTPAPTCLPRGRGRAARGRGVRLRHAPDPGHARACAAAAPRRRSTARPRRRRTGRAARGSARRCGVQRPQGRRGMAHDAVIVILSDGWERGDPALVAREMERLAAWHTGSCGSTRASRPRASRRSRAGWRRRCRSATRY